MIPNRPTPPADVAKLVDVRKLAELQAWMQSLLMHPEATEGGVLPTVADVILPSSRQTSEQRLQVYGNAYFARLLDCLRDEFSALSRFLGPEIFDGLAAAYLSEYPSRTPNLSNLGAEFPRFLRESRTQFGADADQEGETAPWAQFLVDLATVERVQSEVFDGPGIEGLPHLTTAEFSRVPAEEWPGKRLRIAPCLRLLRLDFPIPDYLLAVRHDVDAPLPAALPTYVAVTRRNYLIRRIPLELGEYQLLTRLVEGATIGDAVAATAEQTDDLQALEQSIPRWFQAWTVDGFFIGIE